MFFAVSWTCNSDIISPPKNLKPNGKLLTKLITLSYGYFIPLIEYIFVSTLDSSLYCFLVRSAWAGFWKFVLLLIRGLLMVLVSSACMNNNEPLDVLVMASFFLPILSFCSCSVLHLRYATSLTNCSVFNCVSLEVSGYSWNLMIFLIPSCLLLLMWGQ